VAAQVAAQVVRAALLVQEYLGKDLPAAYEIVKILHMVVVVALVV
jgi:hypothetical protein